MSLRRIAENRHAQERARENAQQDSLLYLKRNMLATADADGQAKAEDIRRQRRRDNLNTNYNSLVEIANAKDEQQQRINESLEQTEQKNSEIRRLERETAEKKFRLQVRDSSPEIRELESKLLIAKLGKERQEHIELQKQIKEQQVVLDKDLERKCAEFQVQQKQRTQEELAKRARTAVSKEDMEKQRLEKEIQRQRQKEEFLKEKLIIDDIVARVTEEEIKDDKKKKDLAGLRRREIEQFMDQREEWRTKERLRQEEEERKIQRFMREKEQTEEELAKTKKARKESKDSYCTQLAIAIEERKKQQDQLENQRIELWMEEQKERDRLVFLEEEAKREKAKTDIMDQFKLSQEKRGQLREQQQREAEAYRQLTRAQAQEEQRLQLLEKQQKLTRQLETRQELEKELLARREAYQGERNVELDVLNKAASEEEVRRKIVDEERQRLLREHAVNLLGHLPPDLEKEIASLKLR